MVWFQCEDCGENLKKPKLPRHLDICSATKLSCLDCGTVFGQDSFQWHTQCLTEAEKYGPKRPSYGSTHANPRDVSKQELDDFDINVELPNRPSWFCRLCDAKTTSEQDFLGHVRGIKHRERAQGFDAKQQKEFEQPIVYNENNQLSDFDISVGLSNQYPWHCSLCNTKSTSEQSLMLDHAKGKKHRENVAWFHAKIQQRQSEQLTGDNDYSEQHPDFDINVGLSNSYPWFCSLCNAKATSQQSLLDHANGRKHRINVKRFNPTQQHQQVEHSTVDKESSEQQTEVDIYVGISNCYPWFCSLCNMKAASQHILLSHANGKTHLANVRLFNANELHQTEEFRMDKKDTVENTYPGNSEQKKVELLVPSGVANGYSQADKKRKREAVTEPWNQEVVQAEEAKGVGEKKSESEKAKKQDHEKKEKKNRKQTESDSRFDFDKEDLKQLLVSYSKEELINLIYMTAEKGSRLVSTIIESADTDISHRNIFVRGFGWDTTREDLKAAFEFYGEIEDCSVVMDNNTGRSKGYGFVLFKRRKDAVEALKIPEKRMYNRTVVCSLASAKPSRIENVHGMVETGKTDITQIANQSEAALPRPELAHGHVHEQRGHQQTMDMFGQSMPFYGYSQPPGFDPMYGAFRSNRMVGSLPNYGMLGSGLMNHGSMLPPNHVGMRGQYFGDGEHAWYPR